VRLRTPTFDCPRPVNRSRHRSTLSLRLSAATLALGLGVATVATAGPAGATSQNMKHELHKLRDCESGDHYHLDTGNGYYGAYQFSKQTWHGLGYSGRPDNASHKHQNHAAKKLHKESGWSAWPSCSETEHLR
jgi:hypothetical protein